MLITGAGSEIGLAAALEAGRLGFPVVAAVPCPSLIPGPKLSSNSCSESRWRLANSVTCFLQKAKSSLKTGLMAR